MRKLGLVSGLLCAVLCAQQGSREGRREGKVPPIVAYTHAPDVQNVHYGPEERNVLDLWKAKSDRPTPLVVYFHPGAFLVGDKSWIEYYDKDLREMCLTHGISVASANYRYSKQAPYPAPMRDCARAIQYLRSRAREWNIDPKLVAAAGGSSGAGISLWIAFHDDLADPRSGDPVLRQSTRIRAAAVVDAQTSYDPRMIAKIIDEKTAQIPPIAQLFGIPRGTDLLKAEDKFALYNDASAIHWLDGSDPPVFLYYTQPYRDLPPTPNAESIHNPRFGYYLKKQMDALGIECVMKLASDYTGDRRRLMSADMLAFLDRLLSPGGGTKSQSQ
jgi:acetyl esterase